MIGETKRDGLGGPWDVEMKRETKPKKGND